LAKVSIRHVFVIVVMFTLGAKARAQSNYFPENAFSDIPSVNRSTSDFYARHLAGLREPSLLEMKKSPSSESYRFLWLRSFLHPVAVRLDVKPDGSAVVTAKIGSGAADLKAGALTNNTSKSLTAEQVRSFLALINDSGFWTLPTHLDGSGGADGAEWIIEGVKNGKYHVVARWSPEEGPIRRLGLILALDLAHIHIPKREIY